MRQTFVTAGVVLAAPLGMAAASIEGSPVRDAIRAPFEGLGVLTPEVADAATQPGASLPAAPPAGPAVEPAAPPAQEAPGAPDAPPLDGVTDVIDGALDDPFELVPDLGEVVP